MRPSRVRGLHEATSGRAGAPASRWSRSDVEAVPRHSCQTYRTTVMMKAKRHRLIDISVFMRNMPNSKGVFGAARHPR